MRTRSVVLLALALGCGLIAAIGINQVMANRKPDEKPTGETKPIFVAITDIEPGDLITPKAVKLEEWPVGKIPSDALYTVDQIDGRRAKNKVFAGDVLRNNRLFQKGETGHLATELIPDGYRVVPVETDEVAGGGGLIRPGDRVDVLVHLEKNPHKGIESTSTRTILQDIKVFAVGDVYRVDPGTEGEKSLSAKTISLLVTPKQAQKLTMASELGHIRLTLRSHSDSTQAELDPTSPSFIRENNNGETRPDESLFKDDKQARPADTAKKSGLLDFLNQLAKESKKPSQTAPTVQQQAPQKWTMRILTGEAVSDVQMEMAGNRRQHWITVDAAAEPEVPSEPAPPVAQLPGSDEDSVQENQDPLDPNLPSDNEETLSNDSQDM